MAAPVCAIGKEFKIELSPKQHHEVQSCGTETWQEKVGNKSLNVGTRAGTLT